MCPAGIFDPVGGGVPPADRAGSGAASLAGAGRRALAPGRGRNAITHYYVRQRLEHCTYVECYLETGRTHQIRVHLASIGKPLVGDCLYGQAGDTFQRRWQQILHGQWLHARCIGFIHPRSKTWMQFEVPLPPELETALHTLGGTEVSADWSMRQQFISAADLTHTQA